MPQTIHIFSAVELEARFVARALSLRRVEGRWESAGERTVIVRAIGIGAAKLPPLDVVREARCIILAGFAGALDPALKVGDVVLDHCPWSVDFAGRRGSIHMSGQMISTPTQKSDLFTQTGALAVDMESNTVRAWAAKASIPFISVRAISDSADQSLDPMLLQLVDSFGRPKPVALARALLRRPLLTVDLLRLRRDSNLAGANLGIAVASLVQQITHLPLQCSAQPPQGHLSDR